MPLIVCTIDLLINRLTYDFLIKVLQESVARKWGERTETRDGRTEEDHLKSLEKNRTNMKVKRDRQ